MKMVSLAGRFNDTAAFAMQEIVARPLEERKEALAKFMRKLNAYGITTVADLFPLRYCKAISAFLKAMEADLTVRIHFYPELISFKPEDVWE